MLPGYVLTFNSSAFLNDNDHELPEGQREQTMANSSFNFDIVPNECYLLLFRYLTFKEKLNLRVACKKLKEKVELDPIVKRILLEKKQIQISYIELQEKLNDSIYPVLHASTKSLFFSSTDGVIKEIDTLFHVNVLSTPLKKNVDPISCISSNQKGSVTWGKSTGELGVFSDRNVRIEDQKEKILSIAFHEDTIFFSSEEGSLTKLDKNGKKINSIVTLPYVITSLAIYTDPDTKETLVFGGTKSIEEEVDPFLELLSDDLFPIFCWTDDLQKIVLFSDKDYFETCHSHTQTIFSLQIHNHSLFSLSKDGLLNQWSISSGNCLKTWNLKAWDETQKKLIDDRNEKTKHLLKAQSFCILDSHLIVYYPQKAFEIFDLDTGICLNDINVQEYFITPDENALDRYKPFSLTSLSSILFTAGPTLMPWELTLKRKSAEDDALHDKVQKNNNNS